MLYLIQFTPNNSIYYLVLINYNTVIFFHISFLDEKLVPGYPLLPLSKGFCLSIIKALKDYKEVLISMNIIFK